MSDIAIIPASVLASSQATLASGTAGATITAGQPVYVDTSDSDKLKLADANASAATANVVGIALHGASAGQPLRYVVKDPDFTPGGTLAIAALSTVICLSATAGGIAPAADLASGMYPVVLGVTKSTSKMILDPVIGTVALTS